MITFSGPGKTLSYHKLVSYYTKAIELKNIQLHIKTTANVYKKGTWICA